MRCLPWWKKQKVAYNQAIELSDEGVPLLMEMGTGKALCLDTPLLTPTGWITMQDAKVGMPLIGKNGKTTFIESVYPQGEQAVYSITFSDGSKANSTLDHLWEVNTPSQKHKGRPPKVLSLKEIMAKGLKDINGNRKFHIPIVDPIEFTPQEVTIDPYLLGALLGDGHLRKSNVVYSKPDPFMLKLLSLKLLDEKVEFRHLKGDTCDYGISGIEYRKNPLLQKLRNLGLLGKNAKAKFIPDEYLFNSIEVRTAILQGLLDTDGYSCGVGSVEYTTISPQLAKQVEFLAQSLGCTVTKTSRYPIYTYKGKKREGQQSHRLYIQVPNSLEPFRTPLKKCVKRTKYHPTRAIESVKFIGNKPVQCIKVSASDGLFVINDCIVTHNTRVAIKWLEYLIRERGATLIYVAAPLAVLHVWIENWHEWATAPVAFIDLHETGSAGIKEAVRLSNQGWPVICLVNYESSWFIGKKREKSVIDGQVHTIVRIIDTCMKDTRWDVGILDESTCIKTPGAKVTSFFCRTMKSRTKFRAILTGTAYIKRPIDVYAQIKFCCKREVFEGDFAAFKLKYTIPHPTIKQAILGYQNLDDFVQRLSSCAILLKKADVVDLPPFVHETRRLDLCAKSQKIYDDITEENYAYLEELENEGVEITASHVFSVLRKQMQITGGFVYPDPDPDTPKIKPAPIRLGTEKVSMMLDIMENRDYPTLVVVQMDEEEKIIAEAIKKKFGFTPKILNGSVQGAAARHELIASAKDDLAFIVKEKVGSKGVDMRFADMTIFYSHSFNTEDYQQMMSRNHRGGQVNSITYVHLLINSTVDMKVMASLREDFKLAQQIERDWRAFIK